MVMNRIILLLTIVSASFNAFSQGFITAKNVKVDLTGFVRNDLDRMQDPSYRKVKKLLLN